MTDVDTSSYPKPTAGKSLFDQVKDLGAIQQQKQSLQSGALTIEKQKLELLSNRMEQFTKGLTALSQNPNLNFDDINNYAKNQVKLGWMDPDTYARTMSTLPQNATPQEYQGRVKQFAMQALQTHDAIQQMYGQNQDINQGNQTAVGVRQSPMQGGAFKQTGTLYQQAPVGQATVNDAGQQGVIGPAGPPGFQPAPQRNLSSMAARPQASKPTVSGGVGPTIERTDLEANPNAPLVQPKTVQTSNVGSDSSFIPTAPPQQFEEGKANLTKDLETSKQKLTAVKPALLAVKLIPGLRSGPGTKTYNDAIAALKANVPGMGDLKPDDPTAIYQEVNKYLSQYLKGRGGRSDADLQAAEESSPNPGKQINPALLKLTQTAVAQDRIEAARALHFGDRKDLQNYNRYAGNFPAQMDERAFSVDMMTPDQKKELAKELKTMKDKNPNQYNRFIKSLEIFKSTGVGQ